MGTIAGTVMGTYIGMLAGGDPVSRGSVCEIFAFGLADGCSGFYCSG